MINIKHLFLHNLEFNKKTILLKIEITPCNKLKFIKTFFFKVTINYTVG